jgi:hypothetical protein
MNIRLKLLNLPLLLFIILPFCSVGQGRVRASLDSTDILIGDEIRLRMEIVLPPGSLLLRIATDTLATVKGIERRRALRRDSLIQDQGISYVQDFILSAFDSGDYRLPPIPVDIQTPSGRSRLISNDLFLSVRPVPLVTDTARLQPIKEIWKEPVRLADFWPYALILAAIPLMVYLFRRMRRKPPPVLLTGEPAVPLAPPHIVALERLEALREKSLLEEKQFKTFQSELVHIFKEYISRRYSVQALESVTEEVVHLLEVSDVEKEWIALAHQVMRDADWVKFAKADLPLERHEAAWQIIFDFVQATKLELDDGRLE